MTRPRTAQQPALNPWLHAAQLLDQAPNPDRARWLAGARPNQLPPPGEWFVWMMLWGRGTGKTRTAGEWLDDEVRSGRTGHQVLIAGRTPSDVRDYALHGPGGLLTNHPDIRHKASERLLVWPNGVEGLIRSGANPEEFRGASSDRAWLDEFAAWDYPEESWNNLMFGMREGKSPRIVIATTPRPIPIVKAIMAMPTTVFSRATSYENRANLADIYVRAVLDPLMGTRLGRQEIEAELLDEVEGALWSLKVIDAGRVKRDAVPDLKRIAVGVDPQGTKKQGSMTGIVAVGEGADGHFYVLEDASVNGTPHEWGHAAVACYERHAADRIVAEKNFGGDMVEQTIRTVRENVSYEAVVASRGKRQRAEPGAALYEQGKVHHAGVFAALEDEMCGFTPDTKESPNRMDALVWALTALAFGEPEVFGGTWGSGRLR